MRLRYLHLPRCGPLSDASMVFGREDLITPTLDMPRKGVLNFMVGVNGSGKSSLLRALYRLFVSLKRRERPELPFTLAWDFTQGKETVTAFLFHSQQANVRSLFATLDPVPNAARRPDWEDLTSALIQGKPHPWLVNVSQIEGPYIFSDPMLFARLPKRLIAYTSGSDEPWERLDDPVFQSLSEYDRVYETEDERPQNWSMEKEWQDVLSVRVRSMITDDIQKALDESSLTDRLSDEAGERLLNELGVLNYTRQKVLSNRMLLKTADDDVYFRFRPDHLRNAGIILGLWQAAKGLSGKTNDIHLKMIRTIFQHGDEQAEGITDGRKIMNRIDWFYPTHLSLTYHDNGDDRVSRRQRQELLCLVALADEVVAQPMGRQQIIISLAPLEPIHLTKLLENIYPLGLPNEDIETIAKRVDGCQTVAEAVLRIFSESERLDSTPLDVFSRLRDWERTGLLENMTLTIKRLHQVKDTDGDMDDVIVTYDQLSDGEQMLLGRMGLIFLLRGQDGSLLLLDEPETHFNDVWKREIVDMLDMGLLNSTRANVVIATHTSIALTDAFAAEVTVLDKTESGVTARNVTGGLFGTDPGEVSMNLFRADSSIGSRSEKILDTLLKKDWKDKEDELVAILNVLGSSFHRAELRAILKQLREKNHGPSSR